MIIYAPRNDTPFEVNYDPKAHEIEVTVGGETFYPDGLMVDVSEFASLESKLVTLESYLLEQAHKMWIDNDGPAEQRDADLCAAAEARME